MLDDKKKKLLRLLVALAWADGRVDQEEMEVVEAMLDAFGAEKGEGDDIREWAKQPRSLDEIDVSDITEDDAELVLFQAVFLTFIDGEQSKEEIDLLNTFSAKIGLSPDRAKTVLDRATLKAKELLPVLDS